ncbi:MAG TPA: CPBP family intramembrane glutamic endopeptidase [Anaerolineales bacterium]|nr:CPBP family intramembrane glutamic endopeptidase [Anaerolineales bacterium]
MNTQTVNPNLTEKETTQLNRVQHFRLFILFLVCGFAIFVFGSNYFDIFPTNKNLTYNLTVSALFLVVALWLKRDKHRNRYWRIAYAFFVASIAFPVTLLLSRWSDVVLGWFNVTIETSRGIGIAKTYEMILIVIPILLLTKLSGADFGSIYLKRGNWKLSLGIGALVLFNMAISALMYFAERFTSADVLGATIVWGLVFSFANGFMEELWLRGVFLKHFQPLFGVGGSVLLTSIVFASIHAGAVYLNPAAVPFLLVYALTLGIGCGYLMMKTDNIWGATLIHAAADLFGFIAFMANV